LEDTAKRNPKFANASVLSLGKWLLSKVNTHKMKNGDTAVKTTYFWVQKLQPQLVTKLKNQQVQKAHT